MSEERDDLKKKFGEVYGADALGGELGLKGVRLSPSQYLGSKGVEGAEQAKIEILQNSVDESAELIAFVEKHGGNISELPEFRIDMTIWQDDTVQIADTGRGVPADFSAKFNRPVLETAFEEINVGGKGKGYVEDGNSAYVGNTIGKHGSGAACANATSDFFYVDSFVMKDNKHYQVGWEKAEKVKPMIEVGSAEGRNGTVVKFRPSRDVFQLYNGKGKEVKRFYNLDKVRNLLTEYAYNTENICFTLRFEKEDGTWEEEVFRSSEHIPEERLKPYTNSKIYSTEVVDLEEGYKMKVFMGIASTRQEYLTCNYLRLIKGTHANAVSEVFEELLPEIAEKATETLQENKINRTISVNILNQMGISNPYSYLSTYLSLFMDDPDYSGQVKEELRVPRVQERMREKFRESFNRDLLELKEELVNYLVNITVKAVEAKHYDDIRKEQDKKRRERNKELKSIVNGSNDPKYVKGMSEEERDLTRARNQNLKEVILFVVEGNTAKDNLLEARDVNNHTVFAINQRPPNVFGHTFDQLKVMKKYRQLYKIFYGNNNGDYKAVVFATDPDADGGLIKSYLLGFLYSFFPNYLKQGRVFLLEAPKYSAMNLDGKRMFFKTLEERNNFMDENHSGGWSYYSYKGLGSIPSEILSDVLEDTNYYVQIDKDSIDEGIDYLRRFLTDKRYKKQLVLDLYGSDQLKYYTLMRKEVLKHQEVEFDVNELSTQYTFEHDFSSVNPSTPLEKMLIDASNVTATLTEEEQELLKSALAEEDDENIIDDEVDDYEE